MFSSDIDYIKSKQFLTGGCKIGEKNCTCGYCFWSNIQIKPEVAVNHKCEMCLQDMETFRNELKSDKSVVKLNLNCTSNCVWFDWFDAIRQSRAKEKKMQVEYVKKKKKE